MGAEREEGMTEQQQIALANVALIAEDCMHPRFGKRTPLGTIILSVNAGYE